MPRTVLFQLDADRAVYRYDGEEFTRFGEVAEQFLLERWQDGSHQTLIVELSGTLKQWIIEHAGMDSSGAGLFVENPSGEIVGTLSWDSIRGFIPRGVEARYYPAQGTYEGEKFTLPDVYEIVA